MIDPKVLAKLQSFFAYVDDTEHLEVHLLPGQVGRIAIYSKTPGDPGGATNRGCTEATLQEALDDGTLRAYADYIGTDMSWPPFTTGKVTDDDVRNLPETVAVVVYYVKFFANAHYDLFAECLAREEWFDTAVGSGTVEATTIGQHVLEKLGTLKMPHGVAYGTVGPLTVGAFNAALTSLGDKPITEEYINQREAFYDRISDPATHPTLTQFRQGWHWRAEAFRKQADAEA